VSHNSTADFVNQKLHICSIVKPQSLLNIYEPRRTHYRRNQEGCLLGEFIRSEGELFKIPDAHLQKPTYSKFIINFKQESRARDLNIFRTISNDF